MPFKQEIWQLFLGQSKKCAVASRTLGHLHRQEHRLYIRRPKPVFVDDFWEKKCRINRRSGNIFWTVAKNFGTIFGRKQDMSNPLGRTISRKLFRVTKSTAAVGMCSGDEESVEGRSVSNRIGITQPRSDDLSSWQDKSSSRKAELSSTGSSFPADLPKSVRLAAVSLDSR